MIKLGLDAKLLRGEAGTTGTIVVENVKDVTLSLESGEADVKLRDILLVNFVYITRNWEIVIKVRLICFLCIFIPLAYKHCINAITESSIKTETNSSDTCE